jgi:hypothetical protein
MKPPKIEAVWKDAHRCFLNQTGNPEIQDLLYCSLMFLREAMKASFGHRPQSSKRIALELIAKRSMRLRLYRSEKKTSLPTISPPTSRNHV